MGSFKYNKYRQAIVSSSILAESKMFKCMALLQRFLFLQRGKIYKYLNFI